MRVCLLIPDLDDGGAQIQAIRLVDSLARKFEIELELVTLRDGVNFERLRKLGFERRNLCGASGFDPRNIFELSKFLKTKDIHILVTFLHAADVIGGIAALFNPNCKWIMTERDSSYPIKIRYLIRRVCASWSDLIVANSQKGARYWEKIYPQKEIKVIGNIVQSEYSDGNSIRGYSILCVSRLVVQKNPRLAVLSALDVLKQDFALDAALVGQGELQGELGEIIQRSGLESRFEMLGYVPEVSQIMMRSRVFLSLSAHEGMPNVVLESIASGMIPVLSKIPEHEAIVGSNYPYLVPLDSPPSAVAGIIRSAISIGSPEDLKYAREILQNLTPDAIGEMYFNLFRQLLKVEG